MIRALKSLLIPSLLALFAGHAVAAPVLQVDSNGILLGATGVDVNGAIYDVVFVDGSCISVFSGCDSDSDFTFQTQAAAIAAAESLRDQVLLDTALGAFDSNPALSFGCGLPALCQFEVPYFAVPGAFGEAIFVNNATVSGDFTFTNFGTSTFDTSLSNAAVFAVFTPVNAVPELETYALMLAGLGALGAATRSRRKSAALR